MLFLSQEKIYSKFFVKKTKPNYYQIVNQEYIS